MPDFHCIFLNPEYVYCVSNICLQNIGDGYYEYIRQHYTQRCFCYPLYNSIYSAEVLNFVELSRILIAFVYMYSEARC